MLLPNRRSSFVLVVLIGITLGITRNSNAQNDPLSKAEKLISSMRTSLNKMAAQIRKATDKSDISLINCLKKKEDQMKRYEKVSMRNYENLQASWKVADKRQTDKFFKLIELALKRVKELEAGIRECHKGEIDEDVTKVNVIKPEEDSGEVTIEDIFQEETTGEPEDLPIVPPSSPYM